jgi:hypothetical protein
MAVQENFFRTGNLQGGKVESESFQFCCGMEELGNFLGTYVEQRDAIASRLQQLAAERQELQEYDNGGSPGGLLATTVPNQTAAVKALKFHKFRKVFTFRNPGTGNKVTLWAKKLVR